MTKLYLRTAAGAIPPSGGKKSDVLPVGQLVNVGGTNLSLSLAKGSTNANVALSYTPATSTHTDGYLRRFCSVALSPQTFGAGLWTYAFGATQGGRINNGAFASLSLYVFRPSTGVVVGFIYDSDAPLGTAWPTSVGVGGRVVTFVGVDVTAQAGDILCFEAWSHGSQPATQTYTATWFYGGSSEPADGGSIGSVASYISSPGFILFPGEANGAAALGGLTAVATATETEYSKVVFGDYAICGMQHDVQVSGAGVYWTTTVVLDTEEDSYWTVHP